MIDYDGSELRKFKKRMLPTADFDATYTFYYDETNNVRKFYVRENDFNATFDGNFILGGLLHEGVAPDVQPLIDSFRLQQNTQEVKFAHIAKGDFLVCLTSQKLRLYLQFVKDSSLYIHYRSVNILYWSIVDIVDSAIEHSEAAQELGLPFASKLKNDLYKLARLEIDSVVQLFHRYQYPNIKEESVIHFIDDLVSLFDQYIDDIEYHFGLESLRQILKEAKKKGTLTFIMDEEDYVLLKNFSHFYLDPISTFKNSTHIFDKEDSIVKLLSEYKIMDEDIEIKNHSFVDSKTNQLVQLSDVFVGLMGKLSVYLNTHTEDQISEDFDQLNDIQEVNIDLLLDIFEKSEKKNFGLCFKVDSTQEIEKMNLIKMLQMKF